MPSISEAFSGFGDFLSVPAIDEQTDQTMQVAELNIQQQLSDQLVFFLETAKPGSIGLIDESPWSTHHEIMAKDFYFSATGKKCREIRLLHSVEGLPHEQHLCLDNNDLWVPIRCISR